jgi:hypothetical protein
MRNKISLWKRTLIGLGFCALVIIGGGFVEGFPAFFIDQGKDIERLVVVIACLGIIGICLIGEEG